MPKDYNQLFKNDPLAFMRMYSCMPANHIGNTGDLIGDLNKDGKIRAYTKGSKAKAQESYEYRSMSDLIGYLDFTKATHVPTNPITNLPDPDYGGQTGQITVTGTYNNAGAATQVLAHYLPWLDNAIVSLTIPPMAQFGGGPKVFFTAAINGCSVFIKGTPQSPTIFHAGGSTYRPKPNEGAKFWRDMMKTRQDTKLGKIQAEVNKTMYVTDKKDKFLGTANSRLFEQWLTANPTGFVIEDVSPTGCVFGLRDSGAWTFYLQENITIKYTGAIIANGQPPRIRERNVVRPMQVREIFPNGNGNATVAPSLSRPLKM